MPEVKAYRCRRCNEELSSNNKLHRHILQCEGRKGQKARKATIANHADSATDIEPVKHPILIKSSRTEMLEPGYAFRSWHYAAIKAGFFDPAEAIYDLVADIGCTMFLIDKKFLVEASPNTMI